MNVPIDNLFGGEAFPPNVGYDDRIAVVTMSLHCNIMNAESQYTAVTISGGRYHGYIKAAWDRIYLNSYGLWCMVHIRKSVK